MLFVVLDCTLVDCISSLFPFSCWYILIALYAPWAFCGFARFTSVHIIIIIIIKDAYNVKVTVEETLKTLAKHISLPLKNDVSYK